jgi:hypothetical protein
MAGCSVAVADDGDRAGASGDPVTRGDVAVQRVVTVADGVDEPDVVSRVSARFLLLSAGLDDGWVAMLVDGDKALPSLGTCSFPSSAPPEPLPPSSPDSSIELLDVGDVMIHAGPSTMPLAARAFPDVGDLVSGVVYTSRDASAELPPGVPYLLETTGSPLVRGFRMALDPPGELDDLTLDGELLRGGDPQVTAADEMVLTWTRDEARNGGDLILVELTPVQEQEAAAATPLRCLYPDSGDARLPALQTMVGTVGDQVDISVHRLRRIVAVLPEIDETAVEFDFAVTARLPVVAVR